MKATEIAKIDVGIVSLDYYNEDSHYFKVASDSGKIFDILRTRTTKPPTSFTAHNPPCVTINFNRYHPEVYATCATDWQIKIWRQEQNDQPLQIYDFAPNIVTHFQWAPYSSTILAAVTSDGQLYIYDINVDRYKPIFKDYILEVYEGQLTYVTFHSKWPIILVGSEKGVVKCLKLSPNIRKNTKITNDGSDRSKLMKSASSKSSSRGLVQNVQQEEDEDNGNKNAEDEDNAKNEQFARDEREKFNKAMGVSWIVNEVVEPPPVSKD